MLRYPFLNNAHYSLGLYEVSFPSAFILKVMSAVLCVSSFLTWHCSFYMQNCIIWGNAAVIYWKMIRTLFHKAGFTKISGFDNPKIAETAVTGATDCDLTCVLAGFVQQTLTPPLLLHLSTYLTLRCISSFIKSPSESQRSEFLCSRLCFCKHRNSSLTLVCYFRA